MTMRPLIVLAEVLCAALVATAGAACGQAPDGIRAGGDTGDIVVTERDNGGVIQVSKGTVVTIRLRTVPGAGYDWTLVESDGASLRLLGAELEMAARSIPGSPAYKVFRFIPDRSGPSTIVLHYVRPWEKGVPPRNTYRLQVDVK
jgi:inhibitor of cysteine peptidase